MNATQIHSLLKLHPDQAAARSVAMMFLEDTSVDSEGFRHIVDPDTGRWQNVFETKKHTYRIISPSDGVSLRRYTKLRQSLSVVLNDANFSDQIQNINTAQKLVDQIATTKEGVVKLSVVLENMKQGIIKSDRNWHFSAYAATLFIIRDGEDVSTYDESIAEEKIADWNEANINASDFFFCCLLWENRWNERLQEFAVRLT